MGRQWEQKRCSMCMGTRQVEGDIEHDELIARILELERRVRLIVDYIDTEITDTGGWWRVLDE